LSTALLFPGQGSQYVGMGIKWIQKYPYAKSFFDRADTALGFSLSAICFEGPDSELVKTEYTQPAILTTSIAMLEILKREKNIKFSHVAGHSLGEYSALVAAGALNFEEAVKVVNLRGKLMQKAVPVGQGKMAAVIRCDEAILSGEIKKADPEGNKLSAANYNSDDQTVVSGAADAVDKLLENLKGLKIKAIPLNVSAPFHSPLMTTIVPEFTAALNKLNISKLNVPYVANVDAIAHGNLSIIVNNLAKQIPGSVLWKQTISTMVDAGVNKAIEVGPGKVLTGLCAKMTKTFECMPMDSLDDLGTL